MTQRFTGFEELLSDLGEQRLRLQMLGTEITRILDDGVAHDLSGDGLASLQRLWSEYSAISSNSDIADRARQSLIEARGEAMSIAMALQVQDITSQQIAGVITLIESVRTQLVDVLASLERDQGVCHPAAVDAPEKPLREDAFNADAQYNRGPSTAKLQMTS